MHTSTPTIQHSFPKIGLDFQIEFLNTNHQTNKSDWKPNIHSWITHISKKTWFSQSGRLSRFVHIQSMISVSSWGKSVTKSLPPSDRQKDGGSLISFKSKFQINIYLLTKTMKQSYDYEYISLYECSCTNNSYSIKDVKLPVKQF